jgi:hypothetical protein
MVEVELHQMPLGTRVPLARLSDAEPAPGSLHEPAVAYDE